MSMNLHFQLGKHHIPFPYQTSTDLTYAVLAADGNKEQQLALIKKDCTDRDILHCYEDVVSTLSDPLVKLDYM